MQQRVESLSKLVGCLGIKDRISAEKRQDLEDTSNGDCVILGFQEKPRS